MNGSSGLSSSANMPRNCGMEGMHTGTGNQKIPNHEHAKETIQNPKANIQDEYRGRTIDIRL
ncbi:hypothetical protein [Paenibacillus sp. FSL L8-0709]|uniref:hypothetical protein n=1 Tax=Paenibacillus sp. FSL L8-0709 TaxID=2975312 RepID=UPI0030F655BA